ncbi:hypothetical protein [Arthrobacter sp. NicSoilC5]|uniref:hypothetical protein n=1 Tax=Micrococcaceae TaxID=1268 RepID=UPI001CC33E96|nr:hypothetical protein [Arthrobacter sp. NicSoilC5]
MHVSTGQPVGARHAGHAFGQGTTAAARVCGEHGTRARQKRALRDAVVHLRGESGRGQTGPRHQLRGKLRY